MHSHLSFEGRKTPTTTRKYDGSCHRRVITLSVQTANRGETTAPFVVFIFGPLHLLLFIFHLQLILLFWSLKLALRDPAFTFWKEKHSLLLPTLLSTPYIPSTLNTVNRDTVSSLKMLENASKKIKFHKKTKSYEDKNIFNDLKHQIVVRKFNVQFSNNQQIFAHPLSRPTWQLFVM